MNKKSKEKKSSSVYWLIWFLSLVVLACLIFLLHTCIEHESLKVNGKPAVSNSVKPSANLTIGPVIEKLPLLPKTSSKYAYVTLISGIDRTYRYRGFFYNALLMKKALAEFGSSADFIVMLGFDEKDWSFFDGDVKLLKALNIKIYVLPRFVDDSHGLSFCEMALLKIIPWSFVQYDRVQFFDGDIMPIMNMDCFFELNQNTFTVGAASPLNSGWYLAIPNYTHFIEMRKLALWRLARDWNKETGWSNPLPVGESGLRYRGGRRACDLWDFNGADMDQGLLTHYYILNNGLGMLIDTDLRTTRLFNNGLLHEKSFDSTVNQELSFCNGKDPTQYFLHFTGQSKPWVKSNKQSKKGDIKALWMDKLKALNLNISDCVLNGDCKSPLGYWNRDFPKGGFKVLEENKLKDYIEI